MKKIVIFDYGLGNLESIYSAFKQVGISVKVSSSLHDLSTASGLVLPGVGAFGSAKRKLIAEAYFDPIAKYLKSGNPVLGICLGMQLLFSESEEGGYHEGFDVIPGSIVEIAKRSPSFKLPNIGWHDIALNHLNVSPHQESLLSHLHGKKMYFLHGYVAKPKDEQHVLATIDYQGKTLVCAAQKENVIGVQFHPEKSGLLGLMLLNKFGKTVGL